jgi:hypothetical protein
LFSNADSIRLTSKFWNDSVTRAAEAQAAQKFAGDCVKGDDGRVTCPQVVSELPVKWTMTEIKELHGGAAWFWFIVMKVFGLLATILAVSLGAPFWFDLLKKIAPGIRMSGQPPAAIARPPAVTVDVETHAPAAVTPPTTASGG